MNGTIDDRYFEWLYQKVAAVTNRNPARSYWNMAKQMYQTRFNWFVPNDDNRAEDGKDLRYEFIDEWGTDGIDRSWLDLDCSMLEMMIALARRVSFEADGTPGEWFWHLMGNLELDLYTDDIYEISIRETVEEVLERVNRRTYLRNGTGGLFPQKHPRRDQRQVEIWYQMQSYLLEREEVAADATIF